MKDRCYLTLTITLAAAVVWLGVNGSTRAEESATVPTDAGFNADAARSIRAWNSKRLRNRKSA